MTSYLEHRLLEVGFHWQPECTIPFAGGILANNKLNLGSDELEAADPALHNAVVEVLTAFATPLNPDFVVGVPNGATGYADKVSGKLTRLLGKDVIAIGLDKDEDREITFLNEVEEHNASLLGRGVLIEDVINSRSSTLRALNLGEFATQIVGVTAVFDRGIPSAVQNIDKPIYSLAKRPIPPDMSPDHPIRLEYAK